MGGSLEQYIGEKHLAELIDYIDRIYVNFGAPEQVYGLENEEEIEAMKRQASWRSSNWCLSGSGIWAPAGVRMSCSECLITWSPGEWRCAHPARLKKFW